MNQRELWQGRRVFLTGHTGFKGGWLAHWMKHLGADVHGYSLPAPTTPSIFEETAVEKVLHHQEGDIRDLEALTAAVAEQRPEVVFHLAAQPLVRASYTDPVGTYASNVMGTVNLLEACRRSESVKAIVIVTTDKCYENREWNWGYRENEAMGGHDPYSNSKGCAELVTSAYRRSFFSPDARHHHPALVATGRAGNVVGGGDWAEDRLVPDIVRSFSRGEPVVIRSPRAIRPWQHVLEPLGGYIRLAEKLLGQDGHKYADGWNFGPSGTASVENVVELLVNRWGGSARWELDHGAQPHEARLLRLDISKAEADLGWSPLLSLEQTADWLVRWYRAYYEKSESLLDLTLEQIVAYEQLTQRASAA